MDTMPVLSVWTLMAHTNIQILLSEGKESIQHNSNSSFPEEVDLETVIFIVTSEISAVDSQL